MENQDKLDSLNKNILELSNKNKNKANNQKSYYNKKEMIIAVNCLLEITSGFVVGGIIGYTLDKIFETRFVFLIIFILLGFGAGLLNLTRYLKRF